MGDDKGVGILLVFTLFTGISFGVVAGWSLATDKYRSEAIELGHAYYDTKTTVFTWQAATER